jgi:predicted esterase
MESKKGNAALKILMLHGYRQNESAFRERTGGLRKSLKSHVEFVFCESPHTVPRQEDEASKASGEQAESGVTSSNTDKGWWFSEKNSCYDALERTDCDLGFEQTLAYINSVFEEKGPFDGILGFSQGACLAGILCKIAETNKETATNGHNKYKSIKFKFAIIIAGFKSGQSGHDCYYDLSNKIPMPTMQIFGETDKVIPFEMSEELSKYFDEPLVVKHAAGHLVPVNAEAKNKFIEFFNVLREKKLF